MKRYRTTTNSSRIPRHRGFTLIELLITISIIAVLIGLLIPALSAVKRTARVAEVRAEISQIESAISDFKAKFNSDPPSRITLHETASGWTMDPQARALIRGIWPKYDFKTRDLNGDNDTNDTIVLRGDQALVFCLGGIYFNEDANNNGSLDAGEDLNGNGVLDPNQGFIGFSSNPTNPFDANSPTATRLGPFMEFKPTRVFDGTTARKSPPATYSAQAPLTRFPVYVDPIRDQVRPYLYACSYDGLGYNDSATLSDVSTYSSDSDPTDSTSEFRIYLTDTKSSAGLPDPGAWKPKGFQIISPGFDGLYGIGGPYKPDANNRLPARVQVGGADVADPARVDEDDNITNLASGMLAP